MAGRGENGVKQSVISETSVPDIVFWNCFFAGWFCLLNFALPRLTARFFPRFWNGLDDKKRKDFPSYAAGMFHHLVIAPCGYYMIYKDYMKTPDQYNNEDYAKTFFGLFSLTYAFGYILGDIIFFTIPQMLVGEFEYLIHHVAALVLYRGLLIGQGAIIRFIPHFMICETSNTIFNTCWFLRNNEDYKNSSILPTLEKCFAIAFFILRIVNLPFAIYCLWQLPSTHNVGIYKWVMVPILGLQYYWLVLIIKALKKKMGGRSSSSDSSEVAAASASSESETRKKK